MELCARTTINRHHKTWADGTVKEPTAREAQGCGSLSGPGRAGRVFEILASAIFRGPTGLTTVLVGLTAISAGAMFRPCAHINLLVTRIIADW